MRNNSQEAKKVLFGMVSDGEEREEELHDVLGHRHLGLQPLLQGDIEIASKHRRSPVSGCLDLKVRTSACMEE